MLLSVPDGVFIL